MSQGLERIELLALDNGDNGLVSTSFDESLDANFAASLDTVFFSPFELVSGLLEGLRAAVAVSEAGVAVSEARVAVLEAGVAVLEAGVPVSEAGVPVSEAGVAVLEAGGRSRSRGRSRGGHQCRICFLGGFGFWDR